MKSCRVCTFSILLAIFMLGWLLLPAAFAADKSERDPLGELSIMFGFSKSTNGPSYTRTKHYTATISYNLTPVTELELSYAYTDTYFNNDPIQSSQTNEQSLGLSVVQSLVPPNWPLQPYVKGGVAQYNRSESSSVAGIPTAPSDTKSPSAILGGGLRVFFLRNFSFKMEAVTYLPDFRISEGKNNFNVQGGLGWNF